MATAALAETIVDKLYTPDNIVVLRLLYADRGRVAQWLRCCATNRKVAGSIPGGVVGIFH